MWAFLLCWSGVGGADTVLSETADVRVLIDISGSMKKNDPDNLRRPAVRMLVGLLQNGSRAGIWTFGQYVNMQVPLGQVDGKWKRKARKGAGSIHSRGLFTNIEEAIKRATADWEGPSYRYRRHLILLTDGMVDVSREPDESIVSRKRILEQWLPRLKEYGVQVHTIALSQRADGMLLERLARGTGGWYEQIEEAEQLQRVFLRLFEKAGRPDTLPLKDNTFRIDDTIEEATLLVFRSTDAVDTRVITPDGIDFGAAEPPANVSWHRDEGYDLLTITQPQTGEWRIQAAIDPDNRVMVVTDLKMQVSELPAWVVMGERLPLSLHFSNQGKRIVKKAFLDLVVVEGQMVDARAPGQPQRILDEGQEGDEKAGDGDFSLLLSGDLAAGQAELVVRADGKTFQREQHQVFELLPPAVIRVEEVAETSESRFIATVDTVLLDITSVAFEGVLIPEQGESQPVMLLPAGGGAEWEVQVDRSRLVGNWELAIHLNATTVTGNRIALNLAPVTIEGAAPSPPLALPPVEPAAEKANSGWVIDAAIFTAGNLLALILAGLGFWVMRRQRGRDQVQLVSDDEGEEVEDAA
jgi:uncharacterized protein (TIGR03503 family)